MQIDSQLIKQCLVNHARQLGRPEYEPCVIKRVTQAFRNETDDPLKTVVLLMMQVKAGQNTQNRRRELVAKFCNRVGRATKILAECSGVQYHTLRRIANFEIQITEDQWAKLLDAFDKAEEKYNETQKLRRKN